MNTKYKITVKGDWERQGFEVECTVSDETAQVIIADILTTLQNFYGRQTLPTKKLKAKETQL